MYLLDTNVISELRRPRPHGGVVAWLNSMPIEELCVPAIVLAELQRGIELIRQSDEAKALEIELWLDQFPLLTATLPMTGDVCRQWARYTYSRSPDLWQDAMIAATAKVHRLTVVTRNLRDFAAFDVPTLDPWDAGRRLR